MIEASNSAEETVHASPVKQPLAPTTPIGTSASPTQKISRLRLDNVEVIDVWSYRAKASGKEYTLFRCKGDGWLAVFALGPEWNGITPIKGNFYNVEAAASSKGLWYFCRKLEPIVTEPGEKRVPVAVLRAHHVEHVPDTQRIALERIEPKLRSKRQEVYDTIEMIVTEKKEENKAGDTNCQEVADRLGRPLHTIAPRFTELLKAGLIEDTKRRVVLHGEYFRVVAIPEKQPPQQTLGQFVEGN